jgi:hypothetical protein
MASRSGGFSLHAATVVPKGERGQLEKLCRYISRPAICLKRLEVQSDGRIAWYLRRAWRDGTKAFVMAPRVFLARLAALVPHPREHQLTYHGVLAPASPLRDLVVPRQVVQEEGGCSARPGHEPQRGAWIPWAELLKRVFGEDVLACPHCHGRRHMISVIIDPEVIRKVLDSMTRSREPPGGGGGCLGAEASDAQIPMPPRQSRLEFGH